MTTIPKDRLNGLKVTSVTQWTWTEDEKMGVISCQVKYLVLNYHGDNDLVFYTALPLTKKLAQSQGK